MSDQDNVKLIHTIDDAGFGVEAIAVTCQGWKHKECGCQDSSTVYKTENGKYCVLLCSDGHSSAKYARDGADAICQVFCDLLDGFENEKAIEEDIVRYFRSKIGKRAILRTWLKIIEKKEKSRPDSIVDTLDKRQLAKMYGATLNAFVITGNYLITMSVGDGSLAAGRLDRGLFPVYVDEEDGISTGGTLSLCNLNSEYMNVSVYKRAEVRYLFALTDGFTKTFDLFVKNSILSQIIDVYEESGWGQVKEEILSFMRSEDISRINDDVSMMFAVVSADEADSASEIATDTEYIINSLFYGDFVKTFPKIGDAEVGAYEILTEEELFDAADVVIGAIKDLEDKGIRISNPVDEVLLYDQEKHSFLLDSEFLYGQDEVQESKNRILHPELILCADEQSAYANQLYLAGLLLKLFEMERLYPFYTYREWLEGKEFSFAYDRARYLDQETLRYLENLYSRKCMPEEIWPVEKWEKKIHAIKKKKQEENALRKYEEEYRTEQEALAKDKELLQTEREHLEGEGIKCQKEIQNINERLKNLHQTEVQIMMELDNLEKRFREIAQKEDDNNRKYQELLQKRPSLEIESEEDPSGSNGTGNLGPLLENTIEKENKEGKRSKWKEEPELENFTWGSIYLVSNPERGCCLLAGTNELSWSDFNLDCHAGEALRVEITLDEREMENNEEIICSSMYNIVGNRCEIEELLTQSEGEKRTAIIWKTEDDFEKTLEVDGVKFCICRRKDETHVSGRV